LRENSDKNFTENDRLQGLETRSISVENKDFEPQEYIGRRFLDLEDLGRQIFVEGSGSISLAGIKVKTESLTPDLAQQVSELKKRMQAVLNKASKKVLAISGSVVLTGLLGGYMAVDYKKPAYFSGRHRAQQEMATQGITEEQRYSAYKPGISELMYRGVSPMLPADVTTALMAIPTAVKSWENFDDFYIEYPGSPPREVQYIYFKSLADAWHLYLGMPQQNNTFGISEYKPVNSKEDTYYYRMNDFLENMRISHPGENPIKVLLNQIENQGGKKIVRHDDESFVMGMYTVSKGEDEKGPYISYWDKYDFDTIVAKNPIMEGVGQPYEIYDRIYYDPQTLEVIP
jgi:hypothetical protein